MFRSSTIDTKSLVQFDDTLSETLVMIYNRSITNGYGKAQMQHIDQGPIDLVMNITVPFHSRRWALAIPATHDVDLFYFAQESITGNTETSTTDSLIGQLLSIESNHTDAWNASSSISFSLQQPYLDASTMPPDYAYKVSLVRLGQDHYSYAFSFQMNTTSRARNISLLFLDLPHSPRYTCTIEITYNQSCRLPDRTTNQSLNYTIHMDMSSSNHSVHSLPIEPMSVVCAQISLLSKDVSVRDLHRTGHFLVLETGCYSFDAKIYENYSAHVRMTCPSHCTPHPILSSSIKTGAN